jgi:thiol-disulfide isomerase/thioredoxin
MFTHSASQGHFSEFKGVILTRPPYLLLSLLIPLLLSFQKTYSQITVQGAIPSASGQVGTLHRHLDFISEAQEQIADFSIDSLGMFRETIEETKGNRVNLRIGTQIITFYVEPNVQYTFTKSGEKLQLLGETGGELNGKMKTFNLQLDSINEKLAGAKKRDLNLGLNEFEALMRETGTDTNPVFRNIALYKIVTAELVILGKLKADAQHEVLLRIDSIFTNSPSQLQNEAYIHAFDYYIDMRCCHFSWNRVPYDQTTNYTDFLLREAEHYENVNETASLLALQLGYKLKLFESKKGINEKARLLVNTLKNPEVKAAGERVIAKNNRIKEGDLFPDHWLLNSDQDSVKISSISSDFILIDFWTTWCTICIQEMKGFDALTKRYEGRLKVVSISCDKLIGKMIDFKKRKGYQWDFLYAGMGREMHDVLNLTGYPTYFILDVDKRIVRIPPVDFDMKKELDAVIK